MTAATIVPEAVASGDIDALEAALVARSVSQCVDMRPRVRAPPYRRTGAGSRTDDGAGARARRVWVTAVGANSTFRHWLLLKMRWHQRLAPLSRAAMPRRVARRPAPLVTAPRPS